MRPEDEACTRIDELLEQAGWVIQDQNQLNLGADKRVAVRKFALSTRVVSPASMRYSRR